MTNAPFTTEQVYAAHGGILYAGELIRAEAWHASLGERLTGDAYFRVVFLESPGGVSPESLHDHRIACYVPGPRPPELGQAEAELRALREARATYATDAGPLDSIATSESGAEDRVVASWAASFRAGRLITTPVMDIDLDPVFADGYWSTWAERIAARLLARAYPEPALNAALLRIPLRPEQDAPVLYDAVLRGIGGASDFAMDAFGPALGIASSLAPRVPDLARCHLIDELVSMAAIGATTGARPLPNVGRALAHDRGLTYPLATLMLLLAVYRDGYALRLNAGHGVRRRDGTTVEADAIAAEDLALLAWPEALWTHARSLDPADDDEVAADLYLRAVAGAVTTHDEGVRVADAWLGSLRIRLLEVHGAVAKLAEAQGAPEDDSHSSQLDALDELAKIPSAAALASRAEHIFSSPDALVDAARLWRAWLDALPHATPLTDAVRFVDAAQVGENAGELHFERETLVGRLHNPALGSAPHQWAALVDAAEHFKERYASAYRRHHGSYHAEVARLARQMEETALKAMALARLGMAVGEGLPALAEELRNELFACGADPTEEALVVDPHCPACRLALDDAAPTREVEELSGYVNDALGTQNRRLAQEVAHRLVGRASHEMIDRFVQVVEVSDLAGLANVLDDELTEFIRALLDESPAGGQRNA